MHAKSFGKPEHEVMIGKEDFSVLAKNLIDEHNGQLPPTKVGGL